MKHKFYALIPLIFAVILFSCKNAEKLYQKGRYDEAVQLAAKKLSNKPGDAGLIDVVQNAYKYAVDDHERNIRNYTNSNSALRFENIYNEYLSLQSLYDAIHGSPSVYDLVQPTDYSAYITTYKEEASNARYDRGMELMSQNSKLGFRDAFAEFQRALALKPGDLAIQRKIDEAYANAVTNIVILPLTHYGFQYSAYNYDMNNFNLNVLRYLNSNTHNQFTKYFGNNQANVRPDNAVEMKFSDVNIGRYRDQKSTREVSRQVVSKEIVFSKDSVIKEYITVKARITETTRTLKADGLLQATARDFSNRWLWSDTYRGEYQWIGSFATYTGDERALSTEDKKLVTQRETFPPSNDEIIRIIMADIQNKTQCGISEYFNRTLN